MTGQIQFTKTSGDGRPSSYKHVEGDLEIDEVGMKKIGKLYYYEVNENEYKTVKFTIQSLSMDCNFLSISGSNVDGYGKVDFLFNTNGFWDSNIEEVKLRMSESISPKYFRKAHGIEEDEEIDFVKLSMDIVKYRQKEKEQKCQN